MLAGKQWLSFEGFYCRHVQLQGLPEDEVILLAPYGRYSVLHN